MRISDWSSDVCSSDLVDARHVGDLLGVLQQEHRPGSLGLLLQRHELQRLEGRLAARRRTAVRDHPGVARPHLLKGRRRACRQPVAFERDPGERALIPQPNECVDAFRRSEEHTSELQSLMRSSYAVYFLKKKKNK